MRPFPPFVTPVTHPHDRGAVLRRNLVTAAASFYGAMAGVAIVWSLLAGRPLFWTGEPPSAGSVLRWMVVGILLGASVILLSRLTLDRFAWAESLAEWFAAVLGPISWKTALMLALLSGFAEEMLFRGAMQPTLGLIPTTVVFGLMHWPPRAELRAWTALTMLLGLVFGVATEMSGHLAAAITAHFLINFVNLTEIGRMSRS